MKKVIQKLKDVEEILAPTAKRKEAIYASVEGWDIAYPEFAELSDSQMHTFWPWDEHKVKNDIDDLTVNMSKPEIMSFTEALLLFTHYELRAGKDYWIGRIAKRFHRPEFQKMASMFAAVELNSHAPFYDQANKVLYLSNQEFYSKWKLDEDLVERMDFIESIVSSKDDLISIAGFTFVEGSILYTNFAYFKHYQAQECAKNYVKNFCRGINQSVGDENTHAVAGALLFRRLLAERNLTEEMKEKLADLIYDLAKVAYEHECKIIEKLFSFGPIKGINAKDMIDFIKHRIDLCLNNLGLKGLFEDEENGEVIQSWFYKNINSIQFHDFFTGGGSEYDSNWNESLFGEVFNPDSPHYVPKFEQYFPTYYDPKDLDHYVVYGKEDCMWCDEVMELASSENVKAEIFKVGKDISTSMYKQLMLQYLPAVPTTVPQVFRIMKDNSVVYIGNGNNFVDDLFKSYGFEGIEANV